MFRFLTIEKGCLAFITVIALRIFPAFIASAEFYQTKDLHWIGIQPDASNNSLAVDYIVVGSGAGGGPLAANLAKAGYRVVLIEAGADKSDELASVPLFNRLLLKIQR